MVISDTLGDVLFIVVTCTRDHSREKGLNKLIRSLNKEHEKIPFTSNLLIFDNNSHTVEPQKYLKAPAVHALCSENLGYWSAINWCIKNAERLLGRRFKFIHPIESDLVMYNMERLFEARSFLSKNKHITSIRTQEFSVKNRKRFFKNGGAFFPVRRSLVANFNGVTNETVDFTPVKGFDNIYLSNWHSKVPALHQLIKFSQVFEKLSKYNEMSEHNFMIEMDKLSPEVGVLDKGIFYAQLNNPFWPWEKSGWATGSWSTAADMQKIGYLSTRQSFIHSTYPEITIKHTV
jgi:hypothetical protein